MRMPCPRPTAARCATPFARLALARLAFGCLAVVAVACSSSKKDGTELTKDQKLGLYLENAIYYLELGDIDRAQFQAEKALELDPDNERFQLIYGRTNVMRGTAPSIEEALRVLEAKPDIADYRWQMTFGAALERKGLLFDEAARGVRDGERATPAADRAARADELAAEARKLWADSRTRYERALGLRTGETEALNGLVRTTALLEQFDASVSWSAELIASIRDSQALAEKQLEAPDITAEEEARLRDNMRKNREFEVNTRLHRATVLRRLGRPSDAVRELEEVIALEPELAQPHSMRGQLLMDLGEYVKARAAFARFLQQTDLPFDDAQVRRAFDLQEECDRRLRQQD